MRPGLKGGGSIGHCGLRACIVAIAASAIAASALLMASRTVSGNPLPWPDEYEGTPLLVGLVLVFLINLPINTFWYSFSVLALSRARMLESAHVPAYYDGALAVKVLGAAVLVSGLGAVIDVFSGEEDVFWFRHISEATILAFNLVFASVVVASVAVPRLRVAPSLMLALSVAVMNLVHWLVIAEVFYGDGTAENPAPYVVAYGVICALLSVVAYRMISRIEPPDDDAATESREEVKVV